MDLFVVLLCLVPIFEFINTKNIKKLLYIPLILYFLCGTPILEKLQVSKFLLIPYLIIGCIITFTLIYNDSKTLQPKK